MCTLIKQQQQQTMSDIVLFDEVEFKEKLLEIQRNIT